MRANRLFAVALIAATALLVPARRANAQTARPGILEGLDVHEAPDHFRVRVRFTVPVLYLRHSPLHRGASIDIRLAPLGPSFSEEGQAIHPQSLHVPRDLPVPIEMIGIDFDAAGEPVVEVRFRRALRFEVVKGQDLRSVVIRIPLEDVRGRAPVARAHEPDAESDPRVAEFMKEGRRAMTAGEYDRAVLVYTKALELPENDQSPAARELLGLARERKGQLAHAKAEYEEYLQRYPDGEGAERVRQRLQVLITARAEAPRPRREPPEDRPRRLDLQSFGSLYLAYRRETQLSEPGARTLDSSLYADIHTDTRLRREAFTLRSQFSGSYRHELLASGKGGAMRIHSAFLEMDRHATGLSGSIGRRARSTGGILGRYDGVQLEYQIDDLWEVGAVAGFPVDSPDPQRHDFDRYLAGLSLAVRPLDESLQLHLYAIGQAQDGIVERAAVGGELRYFQDGQMVAAFVDYDAYFQSLNTAQLVGSWYVTPQTYLTALLDYRNVPTLTMRNALMGQTADTLEGLLGAFSRGDLKDLARDRTARATNLSLGISHAFSERLQFAGDFSAMNISGTKASGGVEVTQGTGFEFSYVVRLIANEVFTPGDIGVLGLRYFDGSRTDVIAMTLDGRYPIFAGLRANPRLWAEYRRNRNLADTVFVRPSLRFDYRIWQLVLQPEAVLDWRVPMNSKLDDQLGYSLMFGIRWDF
jgi:tetratricopeptide (TPR) repeat protein